MSLVIASIIMVTQEKATSMRKDGYSYGLISEQLGILKSTIYRWTKDIEVVNKSNKSKKRRSRKRDMTSYIEYYKDKRLEYQKEGRQRALDLDMRHAMACMLYWAEGSKERNCCKMTNTDVHMLEFFISFLRSEFDTQNSEVSIRLNCYNNEGLSISEIENYWLTKLSLPSSCLRKHTIKENIKKNKVKHPYGICAISLNSTRVVQHIYGAIQEYMSFDDERFLW